MKKSLYTILFMLLATSGIKAIGAIEGAPVEGGKPEGKFNTSALSESSRNEQRYAQQVARRASEGGIVKENNPYALTLYNPEFASKQNNQAARQAARQEIADTGKAISNAASRSFDFGKQIASTAYEMPGILVESAGGKWEPGTLSSATNKASQAVYQGGKAAGQAIGSGLNAVGSGAMAAGRMGIDAASYVGRGAYDAGVATGNAIGSAARTVSGQGRKLDLIESRTDQNLYKNFDNFKNDPNQFKAMSNADGSKTYIDLNTNNRFTESVDGDVYFTKADYSNLASRKISDVTRAGRQGLQSAGSATAEAVNSGINALGSGAKALANKAYNVMNVSAPEIKLNMENESDASIIKDTLNNESKSLKNRPTKGSITHIAKNGDILVENPDGTYTYTQATRANFLARQAKLTFNLVGSAKTAKAKESILTEAVNNAKAEGNAPEVSPEIQKQAIKEATTQMNPKMDQTSWSQTLSNLFNKLFTKKSSSNESNQAQIEQENVSLKNNWTNSDLKNDLVYSPQSSGESKSNNNSDWLNRNSSDLI